jgi:hypothetical protein
MTITMKNYGLTWTDPEGVPRSSAVGYDKPSAEKQKKVLEDAGCADVEIVETRPGQLPQPKA